LKINKLVATSVAALYVWGVGTAVAEIDDKTSNPQLINLEPLVIKQNKLEQLTKQPLNTNNLGKGFNSSGIVNQHFKQNYSTKKFQPESNISGVHTYLVQLKDAPISTYLGGVKGYDPTSLKSKDMKSKSINRLFSKGKAATRSVEKYESLLISRQEDFLVSIQTQGINSIPRHRYTSAINGVSFDMTQEQAKDLALRSDVLRITRVRNLDLLTDVGSEHVGATQIWDGNTQTGGRYMGEGVIVAIIDTGINSDHISFADISGDGFDHSNPWGEGNYVGDCESKFVELCNDKLIGIRSYPEITATYQTSSNDIGNGELRPNDIISPPPGGGNEVPENGEDYNGHGSHVASTAVGNIIFDAPLQGSVPGDGDGINTGFTFDRVSGVAPRANLVAYQACFPGGENAGCPLDTLVAAIDDAIKDGVDVINFSIGGHEAFPWDDPVEMAFLAARESGISVAAAAGNSGLFYTADHASPWLLSVAATTHGRSIEISPKILNNFAGGSFPPSEISGSGISEGITGKIVNAANFGDEMCLNEFFPGTFTSDQIVVCLRGNNPRLEKANNVVAGGAGGFILTNAGSEEALVADVYPIPGIHVDYFSGVQLYNWLASGENHSATISATNISRNVDPMLADKLAGFSSRGPSKTNPNHLIPSISAPGVNIFAAWADQHPFTDAGSSDWSIISGTSMSSPHIAGALALMKQAHPDWSAAEIQSALQMTARNVVTEGGFNPNLEPQILGTFFSGAGVVDLVAATDAGLVMDESYEDFILANPENGGDTRNLNLPELVDWTSPGKSNWIREVTATRDGSWTIEASGDTAGIKVTVIPQSFSLKAGETQAVYVSTEIVDTISPTNELSVRYAEVLLKSPDNTIPMSRWPVVVNKVVNDLPKNLNIVSHRDKDSFLLKGLHIDAANDLTAVVYQPELVEPITVKLEQDDDFITSLFDGEIEGGAFLIDFVQVPENSSRIIIEMLTNLESSLSDKSKRGNLEIYVGIDSNQDGIVQIKDEVLCISHSVAENNYCSITKPEAGSYWVLMRNAPGDFWWEDSSESPTDTYQVATVIVGNEVASNMEINTADSSDGIELVDMEITWDFNELNEGEVFYTGVEIGTDSGNVGDLGFIPVKLTRGSNEIFFKDVKGTVRVGEWMNISLQMLANYSGFDRDFDFSLNLPPGLRLIEDSVYISDVAKQQIEVTDNVIQVQGVQKNTRDVSRDYLITTNLDNELCRTPDLGVDLFGDPSDGGYINLVNYGFGAQFGGVWNELMDIPFNQIWTDVDQYALYHNEEHIPYSSVKISPQGWVQLDNWGMFFPFPRVFPYHDFPDQLIAPLWKGEQFGGTVQTPFYRGFDRNFDSGVTVAATTEKHLIIEWDKARTQDAIFDEFGLRLQDRDDSYDFELILNVGDYNHDAGKFEIMMAYDNLDFGSQDDTGSIGLQGFYGPRTAIAPLYGYSGVKYTWGDLKNKISDDLVICYDYTGPEISEINLSFQVRVMENAVGKTIPINLLSKVEGASDIAITHNVQVSSNIELGSINNYEIDENITLSDILVVYSDSVGGDNTISVSGDFITATVHGHESGSLVDIKPITDFSGETEVTISVSDNNYPSDMDSTSFILTVVGDNHAPRVVVNSEINITEGESVQLDASESWDPEGDQLTFNWEQIAGETLTLDDSTIATPSISNLSAGSFKFKITVGDGELDASQEVSIQVAAKDEPKSKSGSGATSYLLALLLFFLMGRRKVNH